MLLGDPRQADQRTPSFNFSMVILQSLDPAAQGPSFLSLHACVNHSSTVRFLAPTSALEYLTTCTSRSTGQAQIQNAMFRCAVQAIKMHDHDFKVIAIDVTNVSLSLSTTHESHSRTIYQRFRAWYNIRKVVFVFYRIYFIWDTNGVMKDDNNSLQHFGVLHFLQREK